MTEMIAATVLLFLIMDPLGNFADFYVGTQAFGA